MHIFRSDPSTITGVRAQNVQSQGPFLLQVGLGFGELGEAWVSLVP